MWIEIFKKGNHTDSSGNSKSYTDEDIKMIVANYNNKVQESDSFEAPIVKGHPGSDEPAFGWVERLQKKGDLILAKLKDVTPRGIARCYAACNKRIKKCCLYGK